MSGDCGPSDKDCLEILEDVYLYLDGELAAESHTVIKKHLDECSPCLRKYGLENEVKALVARCCGNDHAPEELKAKVLARLRVARGQTDVH